MILIGAAVAPVSLAKMTLKHTPFMGGMQPSRVSRVIGAGRFAGFVSVLLMFTENWSEWSLLFEHRGH